MKFLELLLPVLAAISSLVWIKVQRPKSLEGVVGLAFTVVTAFSIVILAGTYQLYSGEELHETFSRRLICPVLGELPGCQPSRPLALSTPVETDAAPVKSPATPDRDAPSEKKLDDYLGLRVRDVKIIQSALYQRRCFNGEVDGVWGKQTQAAVQAFNTLNRTALSEDGPRIEDIKVILSELSFSCVPEGDRCFDFNGKYVCE